MPDSVNPEDLGPQGNEAPAEDYSTLYEVAGAQHGVDPSLVRAVVEAESSGNRKAVGPDTPYGRASGLGQFEPATARALGITDPTDPTQAIPGIARLLRENYDRYKSVDKAVLAYHGGTDPRNWGPKTQAYHGKVAKLYSDYVAQAQAEAAPEAPNPQDTGGLNFDDLIPAAGGDPKDQGLSFDDLIPSEEEVPAAPARPSPFAAYNPLDLGTATLHRNAPYVREDALQTNSFETMLKPSEEKRFRAWVAENKVPFDATSQEPSDYDMRGFWKALQSGDPRAKTAIDPNDHRLHFPDYWKTPYHETFSNESQWATPDAPRWNDKDELVDQQGNVVFDPRAQKPQAANAAPMPSSPLFRTTQRAVEGAKEGAQFGEPVFTTVNDPRLHELAIPRNEAEQAQLGALNRREAFERAQEQAKLDPTGAESEGLPDLPALLKDTPVGKQIANMAYRMGLGGLDLMGRVWMAGVQGGSGAIEQGLIELGADPSDAKGIARDVTAYGEIGGHMGVGAPGIPHIPRNPVGEPAVPTPRDAAADFSFAGARAMETPRLPAPSMANRPPAGRRGPDVTVEPTPAQAGQEPAPGAQTAYRQGETPPSGAAADIQRYAEQTLPDLVEPRGAGESVDKGLPEQGKEPVTPAETGPSESAPSVTFNDLIPGAGKRDQPINLEHPDDLAAAERHVETEPTDAQKEAGNYQKGHVVWNGLPVTIENPKGSIRRGDGPDGPWEVEMPAAYGYIKRSEGADGDQVDVYLGNGLKTGEDYDTGKRQTVYVIDQVDPSTGEFDEHKAMVGFPSARTAIDTYRDAFSPSGTGNFRIGAVTPMTVDQFKDWVKNGDTKNPVGTLRSATTEAPDLTVKGAVEAHLLEQGVDERTIASVLRAVAPHYPLGRDSAKFWKLSEIDAEMARRQAAPEEQPNSTTFTYPKHKIVKVSGAAPGQEFQATVTDGPFKGVVASGYSRDDARGNLGTELSQRSAAQEQPTPPADSGERAGWTRIGTNANGLPVYEDKRGVRSYVDHGVRTVEPVGIVPTRSGTRAIEVPTDRSNRPEFEPVAEHPGLVVKSLETGKTTEIQPKGTVRPAAEPVNAENEPTWFKEYTTAGRKDLALKSGLGEKAAERLSKMVWHAMTEGERSGLERAHNSAEIPKGIEITSRATTEPERKGFGNAEGREYTAVAKRENPHSVERGYGATREEAIRDAIARVRHSEAAVKAAAPEAVPEEREPSPEVHLADSIADLLGLDDKPLAIKDVQKIADRIYGGTMAQGKYARDQLYDAIELAVNKHIEANPEAYWADANSMTLPRAREAANRLRVLKERVPTQSVRAGEKETHQQFSTPPDYSYAAVYAADIRPTDDVLEPSAGTGSLAVHAINAGARKVWANEVSDKRADMLDSLGLDRVTRENAEQLNNVLPDDIKPTVVVMNPPFSQTAGRMGDKKVIETGAVHVEQALKRLEPGGRLVSIVGSGMGPDAARFKGWWDRIRKEYDVRANVLMDGDIYRKYGTTFPTRVLVIDKAPPSGRPEVRDSVTSAVGLINALKGIRDDRPEIRSAGEQVAGEPRSAALAPRSEGEPGPRGALSQPTGSVGPGSGREPVISGRGGERQLGTPGRNPAGAGVEAGGERGERAPVADRESERPVKSGTNGVAAGEPAGGKEPAGRGSDRAGNSLRPDGSGQRDEPGVTPAPQTVVLDEAAVTDPENTTLSEAVYEAYKPQRVTIAGAKKHPGALVQSAAMASVRPPAPSYKIALPQALIDKGALSEAQLEAVIYAGDAHSEMLPESGDMPERRRGYFIGDGTGVGKGREVAGIILDNWMQGRKKAVWASEKRGLVTDARRDWKGLDQNEKTIFDLSAVKPADKIMPAEGILFATYDTMKAAEQIKGADPTKPNEKKRGRSRVDQIVDWVGEDFDGVLALDEAHNLGNAIDTKGERGPKKASQKALAGVELMRRLPNARVVYVSATGATEINNLAYLDRLGLWGPGTAFPGRREFMQEIGSGGIAALEVVARDMKAMGSYIARSLSYDGVEYDRLEHVLEPHQREIYDKLAEGWQVALRDMNKAMEKTGVTDSRDDGSTKTLNVQAKSAMLSAFWGAHQRFFNQIITSMQMPTVLKAVEKDVAAGRQAVLQLVNTNEAAQERALARIRTEEDPAALEDLDMTPRDQLLQMVDKAFPTTQFEQYVDEEGNERSRPAVDSQGNVVQNREALAMKDRLLEQLGSIRVPDGPLEMLLNHFGVDKVAEVTGRKQRVVKKPDAKGRMVTQVEKRSGSMNEVEANAFQGAKKPILVFSEAGGTGRSYHAENGTPSANARRSHYLVQAGWRADKAVQGFGRTHRTNEASQPIYHLVTTDLQGQKRFISSIARRLAQLGALTKGERKTGDQGMFGMRDNLESQEAHDALRQLFRDALRNNIEGISPSVFERDMGLKLRDPQTGGEVLALPPMSQFLNRLLSLKVDDQNAVFQAFSDRLEAAIERAAASGTLDVGVETYKADKIEKKAEQTVYTEPRTGAETKHVHLVTSHRTKPRTFDSVLQDEKNLEKYGRTRRTKRVKADDGAPPPVEQKGIFFVRSKRSGKVVAAFPTSDYTTPKGEVIPQYKLMDPTDYQYINKHNIDVDYEGNWEKVPDRDEARKLWDAQVAQVPKFEQRDLHLVTGVILPIWDRLKAADTTRIYRLATDKGERMLGRVIDNDVIDQVLEKLGAEKIKIAASPAEMRDRVLKGDTIKLVNDWKIARRIVAGEPRIEVQGIDYREGDPLKADGLMSERIGWQTRYFIPTDERAAELLAKITKRHPAVYIGAPTKEPKFHVARPPAKIELPRSPMSSPEPVKQPKFQAAKRDVTESAEFKKWFKDSKVVDADGKPLVVYHGTDTSFPAFQRTEDIGFHFGTHATANARLEQIEHPEGGNVVPAYLAIKNPLRLPDLYTWEPRAVVDALEDAGVLSPAEAEKARENSIIDREWTQKALAKKGYDGVVYENATEGGGDSYIAFRPEQIKSTLNQFNVAASESPLFQRRGAFYSQLTRATEDLKQEKGTGEQFLAQLKRAGVKDEELAWTGTDDFLKGKTGVTKAALLDHVRENEVKIREVTKSAAGDEDGGSSSQDQEDRRLLAEVLQRNELAGEYDDVDKTVGEVARALLYEEEIAGGDDVAVLNRLTQSDARTGSIDDSTQYSHYTLPGGRNYRELLLILQHPPKGDDAALLDGIKDANARGDTAEATRLAAEYAGHGPDNYKSGHWGERDILAHVRFNERIEASYTPEQIADIGERIRVAIGAKDVKNIASGGPGVAVTKGAITPLEAAQFSHARGFRNVDLTGAERKLLHVEEIQSDWHQQGRRLGYRGQTTIPNEINTDGWTAEYHSPNGGEKYGGWNVHDADGKIVFDMREGPYTLDADAAIRRAASAKLGEMIAQEKQRLPDAPLKKTWHEMAFRRMVAYATEHGYDGITWTTGAQQADRYDLRDTIKSIKWWSHRGGRLVELHPTNGAHLEFHVTAEGKIEATGKLVNGHEFDGQDFRDVVGKDIAEKIAAAPSGTLKGDGLKVGGEGMRGFYDRILPAYASKFGRKFGAQVGETKVMVGPNERAVAAAERRGDSRAIGDAMGGQETVHYLPITEDMRKTVAAEGVPLFKVGDGQESAQTFRPLGPGAEVADLTPAEREKASALIREVEAVLAKLAPGARVRAYKAIRATSDQTSFVPGPVYGAYGQDKAGNVIIWALETPDAVGTNVHEALHYLRDNGFFKDGEWETLTKAARDEGWVKKNQIDKDYPNLDEEGQAEEAIAEELRSYHHSTKRTSWSQPIRAIFNRIMLMMQRIREAARRIFGKEPTAHDIFAKIMRGEVGRRRPSDIVGHRIEPAFQTAWHGSPHDFDSFDMNKIGKGEGAQAFGHGLYFAGKKAVAEYYRDTITGQHAGGAPNRDYPVYRGKIVARIKDGKAVPVLINMDWRAPMHAVLEHAVDHNISLAQSFRDFAENRAQSSLFTRWLRPDMTKLRRVIAGATIADAPKGKLYQVELAPAEDEYLRWDLSMSEQSDKVKAAIDRLPSDPVMDAWRENGAWEKIAGGTLYRHLASRLEPPVVDRPGVPKGWSTAATGFAGQPAASRMLHEAGIPGIKYSDQISRFKPLREIKQQFLDALPEDASAEEVMGMVGTGHFTPAQDVVIKALDADGWLGFDYPAQAISAAYAADAPRTYDMSPAMVQAIAATRKDGTFNYVVFDDKLVTVTQKFQRAPRKKPEPQAEEFSSPEAATESVTKKLLSPLRSFLKTETAQRIVNSRALQDAAEKARDFADEVSMRVNPMSIGSDRAKAAAKDYANEERRISYHLSQIDKMVKANYSPEERARMGEALDEQSVMDQQGIKDPESGLGRLSQDERALVDMLNTMSERAWEQMKDVGVVQGEGLPHYMPRYFVNVTKEGKISRVRGRGGVTALDPLGTNLRTAGPGHRKYLTPEETAAAAQAKLGDETTLVTDIRSLLTSLQRSQRAVAGKNLINAIRSIGSKSGVETVSDHQFEGSFTLDHPAFYETRPAFVREGDKIVPLRDKNGKIIFERKPLFVAREFEGPLRAVLTAPPGMIYNGLMQLKSTAVSIIMMSPMTHNMVIYGKAFPLMPGKMLTLKLYRDGYGVRKNAPLMDKFIGAGMVPINGGWMQDVLGVAQDVGAPPGKSLIAKGAGTLVGAIGGRRANYAVRRAIDSAGDFWHGTLLWDRIADLQAGIADTMRQRLMEKGMADNEATLIGAHLANRFAGILPKEAMSDIARKTANITLFSRQFTLGNIGIMKDALMGLPSEVRAQIGRDSEKIAADAAKSAARRIAMGTFMKDLALFYGLNAVLQIALQALNSYLGDDKGDAMDRLGRVGRGVARGFIRRAQGLMANRTEHPLNWLNPFDDLASLLPNSENEPGKADRVFAGTDAKGRGIYVRNPFGKVGEEFKNWLTEPLGQLKAKLSPFIRPLVDITANRDYFGHKIYSPEDNTVSSDIESLGKIISYYFKQQVPLAQFQGGYDLVAGSPEPEMSAAKSVLPFLTGVTVSRGDPAGPVGAIQRQVREREDRKFLSAYPEVVAAVKSGEFETAQKRLLEAGVPPERINTLIFNILEPQRKTMPTGSFGRVFNRNATPGDRDRAKNVNR